jgi:hypothetical protein
MMLGSHEMLGSAVCDLKEYVVVCYSYSVTNLNLDAKLEAVAVLF